MSGPVPVETLLIGDESKPLPSQCFHIKFYNAWISFGGGNVETKVSLRSSILDIGKACNHM